MQRLLEALASTPENSRAGKETTNETGAARCRDR